MMKLTAHLDESLVRAIRRLAARRHCTRAKIMREAVADYLRNYRRPQIKGMGSYDSGRTDVSERAEELLWEAARGGLRLPLIRSKRPGNRALTNAEIEDILS